MATTFDQYTAQTATPSTNALARGTAGNGGIPTAPAGVQPGQGYILTRSKTPIQGAEAIGNDTYRLDAYTAQLRGIVGRYYAKPAGGTTTPPATGGGTTTPPTTGGGTTTPPTTGGGTTTPPTTTTPTRPPGILVPGTHQYQGTPGGQVNGFYAGTPATTDQYGAVGAEAAYGYAPWWNTDNAPGTTQPTDGSIGFDDGAPSTTTPTPGGSTGGTTTPPRNTSMGQWGSQYDAVAGLLGKIAGLGGAGTQFNDWMTKHQA